LTLCLAVRSINETLAMAQKFQSQLAGPWASSNKLVSLGTGRVCEYCGDYNPAGLMRCGRCGAPTSEKAFAKVAPLPFIMRSVEWEEMRYADGYNPLPNRPFTLFHLEMTAYEPVVYPDHFELFTNGISELAAVPAGYFTPPHTYLCEWCGFVVLEGQNCPGCGGTRLPWREVVRMERVCLYCGGDVVGGVVCAGCGARIAKGAVMTVEQMRGGL
jgi:predicted amidophosphoribosyltransferase